jgi:uncharacterized membrane protein
LLLLIVLILLLLCVVLVVVFVCTVLYAVRNGDGLIVSPSSRKARPRRTARLASARATTTAC